MLGKENENELMTIIKGGISDVPFRSVRSRKAISAVIKFPFSSLPYMTYIHFEQCFVQMDYGRRDLRIKRPLRCSRCATPGSSRPSSRGPLGRAPWR